MIHTISILVICRRTASDNVSRSLGHSDSKITKEIYLHMTKKLKQIEESQISKANLLCLFFMSSRIKSFNNLPLFIYTKKKKSSENQ